MFLKTKSYGTKLLSIGSKIQISGLQKWLLVMSTVAEDPSVAGKAACWFPAA